MKTNDFNLEARTPRYGYVRSPVHPRAFQILKYPESRAADPKPVGDYTVLDTGTADIFAIRYDYEGKSLLIVHNFSEQPRTGAIPSGNAKILYDLMPDPQDKKTEKGKFTVALDGYGYKWYRIDHVIP